MLHWVPNGNWAVWHLCPGEIAMPQRCVVGGCSNVPDCRTSVHRFPIGEKLKRKWTKFVQATRRNFVAPSKYSTVCSAHFNKKCFLPVCGWPKVTEGKPPKRKLRSGAIPTIRHPADVSHILNERNSSVLEKRKKPRVDQSELAEIEPSIVHNGTILESENDTPDSKGTIIPLDQIPTSAVPASCLSDMHLKRVYKKEETRPKKESIANFKPKLSKGRKEVILPGEDYPFALLHHDYIETMSESLKDYIVSKELHSAEANGSHSNSKTAKITKQVKDKPRSKTRQRKRRSLLMYSGKTKLERNLYRSLVKHVQMEKATEEWLADDVQTRLRSQADDDTPITSEIKKQKFDSPPSGNSLKRPKRRRKRLSLYGGRTKLERNPHKYRTKIPTPTKPAESVAIEEDSVWNGSSSLKVDEDAICDYKKQLVQSMYSMQKSGTFCDFTILAGSPRTRRQFSILVHRLVFASVSNKIKYHQANILDAAEYWNKLDAPRIVEFVYTGNMEGTKTLTQDVIKRLHRAAVFLEIPKCVAYLEALKIVQTPSVAEIEDCVPLNTAVPDVDASFTLPPLLALNSSLDDEVFDIAEDIRVESVVSVVCVTTDTSGEEGPLDTGKGILKNTQKRRRRFKKRRPR